MADKSLNDYMKDFYKSMVDGLGPTLFGTINMNPTAGIPAAAQVSDVTAFSGDVAAPGAGAVIAATAALAAGTWDITCYTNLSGTTAGLDRPNLAFQSGGATKMTIVSTMGGITDPTAIRQTYATPTVAQIIAIAASTAGSVYRASIVARRVN